MEGLEIVNTDNIISCTSDSNYTTIRFKNGNKILISKTLKDIEELLGTNSFVRIHNSHVVNLNEITKYVRGEGGYVVMSDGTSLDVSRSRKESLMKRLHRSL
jgi:two-component system LytT family response regulator